MTDLSFDENVLGKFAPYTFITGILPMVPSTAIYFANSAAHVRKPRRHAP